MLRVAMLRVAMLRVAMLRVAMQTAALSRRCYLSWVDLRCVRQAAPSNWESRLSATALKRDGAQVGRGLSGTRLSCVFVRWSPLTVA